MPCGSGKLGQAVLVRDPDEGVAADGTITTGVARSRVPQPFEPVLSTAVEAIAEAGRDASVFLYGSVATGRARHAQADVDLLTVGLGPGLAAELGRELSSQFSGLCRGVEIAAATPDDLAGASDGAYGSRVFLRHRALAAHRWAEIEPELGPALHALLAWSDGRVLPGRQAVQRMLDDTTPRITAAFARTIGLWP